MMQKNISVKNLRDSQKNMISFNFVLVVVNFLFLFLGGLLYIYALNHGAEYQQAAAAGGKMQLVMDNKNIIGDPLFPTLALHGMMPQAISIIFIIALISALFPSADGALTALTSSFCIDILGLKRREDMTEKQRKRVRLTVHLTFTLVFMLCILIFKSIGDRSIIDRILDLAGYTYGPLLGFFSFGIFTKRSLPDNYLVTAVCLIAPFICIFISQNAAKWFGGYQIGIELLLINGIITFLGLLLISKKPQPVQTKIAA